jgi:hypothetical protein
MKKRKTLVFLLAVLVGWAGSALSADLPPAGIDRFDVIVEMTVQARLGPDPTPLGPDPTPFKLFLTGPVVVQRGAPQQARGGNYTIATEILSMDLSTSDLVVGRNRLKVNLSQFPRLRSVGEIQTNGRSLDGATSFFDVFFDLRIGDQTFSASQPVRLQAMINAFPPIGTAYLTNTSPAGMTFSPIVASTGLTDVFSIPLSGGAVLQNMQFIPSGPADAAIMKQGNSNQNQILDFQSWIFPCPLCPFLQPPPVTTVKVSGVVSNKNTNAGLPGYFVFAGTNPADLSTMLSPSSNAVTNSSGAYSFTVPKGSTGFVFVTPPTPCSTSSPLTTFQTDVVFNFQICP